MFFALFPPLSVLSESDKKTIPFSTKTPKLCDVFANIWDLVSCAPYEIERLVQNPIVSILIKRNWAHGLCRHFDANGEADISIWIFVFIFRQTISMKCGNVSIFRFCHKSEKQIRSMWTVCVCVCVCVCSCCLSMRCARFKVVLIVYFVLNQLSNFPTYFLRQYFFHFYRCCLEIK